MGLSIKQIEAALKSTGGFVSKAAEKLGVTPGAISQRIKKSELLQQVKTDAIESTLDLAETKLIENIKAGKEASIFFYLKTKGKNRGYIEKQEIRHEGQIDSAIKKQRESNLTPEELIQEMKRRGLPIPDID